MLITSLALLLLNYFSAKTTRELMFRAKYASAQDKIQVVASAFSGVDPLTPESAEQVISVLGNINAARLIVTNAEGTAVYDSSENQNAIGQRVLLPAVVEALRGSDDLAKNAPGNDWELLNRSVVALSRDTAQFRSIIRTISPYVLCQLLCELVDGAELDGDSVRQTLSSLPDTLPCEGTFLLFVTSNSVSGILNPAAMDHTIKNLQNIQFPHWRLYSFAYQYSILTVACLQDRQTVSDGEVEDLTRTIRVFTHNLPNSAVVCSPRFCDLLQIRGVYQALVFHSQASAARQVMWQPRTERSDNPGP